MRIKEELKEFGYFWLPSAPDKQISGILSISDGGIVKLELFGMFGTFNNHSREIERIVGHVEKMGFVTLDDCYCKSMWSSVDTSRTFDELVKSSIEVMRFFTGVAYREGEIPHFDTLTFSIEGIDEWVGISGIEVDHQLEQHAATISYKLPENITLKLDNGMELLIAFSWQPPPFSVVPKESKVTQKTNFHLVSQNICELDLFISIANKLTTFLCFAINEIVCLDSMSTVFDTPHQDVREGLMKMNSVNIYYRSWPYTKDEPKFNLYNMLFGFKEIQNDAEGIINNWIKGYEQYDSAFRLYFLAKMGEQTYLEEKFLTLVQALEAYHQRICRKMNLRGRIMNIIEPFKDIIGTDENRQKLINSIMDTRNYLTHHNPSKELKAAKGVNLWPLCLKMELLLELHFLQLMGFSREKIDSIVDNSPELKRKLD